MSTDSTAPTKILANGVAIPAIGLGTWPLNDAEAEIAVATALQTGYRLIDTAENYGNETGVGAGIRRSGVARAEVFLTTKFNAKFHSVAGVHETARASLQRLELDYIDLLLVHWPNPQQDRYVEAVEGLTRVLEAGLVRAIGVSNFKPAHLQRVLDAGFKPHVNQVQLDPFIRNDEADNFGAAHGIVTESWSPIGRGGDLLTNSVVTRLAGELQRTPAQVVLRWHVQHGLVPLPKSANPERQRQNLNLFDFALSADQLAALDGLRRDDAERMDSDKFGH